ncbi:MAG: hypothetical protein Q4C89_10470 [Deinococcus sp.]|uniref:hypothetical protein n=1 Tax=Deinococcus sp. TaxID=47478 RepID=UPI0026DDB039|nr:hypothetical protein [Deinococcus sp.]MDO4246437.1 hypothetical protein [Deinococcus sp.]
MFISMVLASLLGGSGQPAPDAELSALRAKYVGKTVWVYGGGKFSCSQKNSTSWLTALPTEPVQVLAVERLRVTFPVSPVKRSGVLPPQKVENPLRLTLRLSPNYAVTSWGFGGGVDNHPKAADCRRVTETYLDGADLEKNFSLTPPNANIRQIFAEYLKNGPLSAPNSLGLTHSKCCGCAGFQKARWATSRPSSAPPPGSGMALLGAATTSFTSRMTVW